MTIIKVRDVHPSQFSIQMNFESAASDGLGGKGRILMGGTGQVSENTQQVPCFTLQTLMLALNRTHIDYLSLDVEGLELEVLKTIPFQKLTITAITVEYNHVPGGRTGLINYMERKGYKMYKNIHKISKKHGLYARDLMFVER